MSSSISNFEERSPAVWLALLLACAAGLLIGWMRSPDPYASAPRWYWQMKAEWRNAAEIVLAGDSRVYRGLDPREFAAVLDGDCVNFGFSGVGFGPDYLNAIEKVLKQDVATPTIVLGVTPWSLTPKSVLENGFASAVTASLSSGLPARILHRFDGLVEDFRPVDIASIWRGRLQQEYADQRALKQNYRQNFHENGWVASDYQLRDTSRGVTISEMDHANKNTVSAELLESLADRIRKWRQLNWRVVAFRPPTPTDAAKLADKLSGYDEVAIAELLTKAGAKWVRLSPENYETYDGSHLTEVDARKLSRNLANAALEAGGR